MGLQAGASKEVVVALRLRSAFMSGVTDSGRAENFGIFSVSMFAAAMIFSCPQFELSIYSTCKRISQKLLRNIVKFLEIIHTELAIAPSKVLRLNSEEIHIKGNEGPMDVRVVNSYPSKVKARPPLLSA